jgi:hypothetical protein
VCGGCTTWRDLSFRKFVHRSNMTSTLKREAQREARRRRKCSVLSKQPYQIMKWWVCPGGRCWAKRMSSPLEKLIGEFWEITQLKWIACLCTLFLCASSHSWKCEKKDEPLGATIATMLRTEARTHHSTKDAGRPSQNQQRMPTAQDTYQEREPSRIILWSMPRCGLTSGTLPIYFQSLVCRFASSSLVIRYYVGIACKYRYTLEGYPQGLF